MNTPGKASLPVIKRLPKYYRYLRTLKNDGITSISSRELAAQMGTTASQVRQDFNCIGDASCAAYAASFASALFIALIAASFI